MNESQVKALLEKKYEYLLQFFKLKERNEYISSKIKFDTSLILKEDFFNLFEEDFETNIIKWNEIKLSSKDNDQIIGFVTLEPKNQNDLKNNYKSFMFRSYIQCFSSNDELKLLEKFSKISQILSSQSFIIQNINKLYFKYITEFNKNNFEIKEIQSNVKLQIDIYLKDIENVILNKLQIEGIKFTEPTSIQNFQTEEKIIYIKVMELNPQTRYGVVDILTDKENRYSYSNFYIQDIIPILLDKIQKKNVSNI